MKRSRSASPVTKAVPPVLASKPGALAGDIRKLIEAARQQVAQTVNIGLTLLHWQVGNRIRREILREKRADYGAEIVS